MGTKSIPLGHRGEKQQQYTVVDAEDYGYLSQFSWSLKAQNKYVGRTIYGDEGRQVVYMHREIIGCTKGDGVHVDHIDCNPLNNTKANLRRSNPMKNAQNRKGANKNSTTGIRNVYMRANGSYRVLVTAKGKKHYGGDFRNILEAQVVAEQLRKELFHQPPSVAELDQAA